MPHGGYNSRMTEPQKCLPTISAVRNTGTRERLLSEWAKHTNSKRLRGQCGLLQNSFTADAIGGNEEMWCIKEGLI